MRAAGVQLSLSFTVTEHLLTLALGSRAGQTGPRRAVGVCGPGGTYVVRRNFRDGGISVESYQMWESLAEGRSQKEGCGPARAMALCAWRGWGAQKGRRLLMEVGF